MPRVVVALLVVLLALAIGWLAWPQFDTEVEAEPPPAAPEVVTVPAEMTSAGDSAAPSPVVDEEPPPERTELPFEPPPATPAAGRGRVTGQALWADDREPIADLPVRLQQSSLPRHVLRALTATTDRTGTFAFADVPAQTHVLTSAVGGSRSITVRDGKETRVNLLVPRGVKVRGVVRDERSQPVAAASIWMSERNTWDAGTVVARSDAQGEFALASVDGAHWIGARAKGYRDSALSLVDGKQGEERRLEIALVRNDARVRGFVRAPDGNPCAGAVVQASPPGEPKWQPGLDGTQQRAWAPVDGTTDAAGAFSLEGLPPGDLVVRAHADGYGKAVAQVTVAVGGLADVVLDLPVAAHVEGRVTDGSGAPAANAMLYFARMGDIDLVWARTDGEGKYAAAGVSSGELPVQVWHGRRLALSTTLTLAPGETRVWNPVLGASAALRGRVVDSQQAPLSGYSVAVSRGERGIAETKTDDAGRFEFEDLEVQNLTLRVGVQPGGGREHARLTVLLVPDVLPPRDDLLLVVPEDKLPSVTVLGRALRADGAPAVSATLRLGAADGRGVADAAADARGAFQLTRILPGIYWITVVDPEHPTLILGQRTLAPRAELNLGDLQLTAGGRVVVTPRTAPGLEGSELTIEVIDAESRGLGNLQRAGDTLRSALLPPGQLTLVVTGARIARARKEVAVQAGQDTHVEVMVEPGLHRVVRAQLPAETPPPRWVWATLYRGTVMFGSCALQRADDGSWVTELWLPAEDCEIWVGSEGNKLGGHAAIGAGLPGGAVVAVQLQPRR